MIECIAFGDENPVAVWNVTQLTCERKSQYSGIFNGRLLESTEVMAELERIGFRVRTQNGYGRFRLYPGMQAIVARKRAA